MYINKDTYKDTLLLCARACCRGYTCVLVCLCACALLRTCVFFFLRLTVDHCIPLSLFGSHNISSSHSPTICLSLPLFHPLTLPLSKLMSRFLQHKMCVFICVLSFSLLIHELQFLVCNDSFVVFSCSLPLPLPLSFSLPLSRRRGFESFFTHEPNKPAWSAFVYCAASLARTLSMHTDTYTHAH